MKKRIFLAVPFWAVGCVLGAAGIAGALQSYAADNTPAYTVTIPAAVSLGETAVISADTSGLSEGQSVRVWLTGTGETDNAFRLHSGSHELTYAVQQNGEAVEIGTAVLNAKPGDTTPAELAFTLPEERPYPGTYTGTVQFTVSALDENRRNVAVPGMGYVNAGAGETAVKIGLYNPEGNPCYFQYAITLKDTGETIYQSDELIAPGMQVGTIELAHALEAGMYDAVLHVTVLSLDTQETMNGSEIAFELRVK